MYLKMVQVFMLMTEPQVCAMCVSSSFSIFQVFKSNVIDFITKKSLKIFSTEDLLFVIREYYDNRLTPHE